eukprot:COSAG01_NODE_88_length_27337_cov_22.941699_15_plen_72_part_00
MALGGLSFDCWWQGSRPTPCVRVGVRLRYGDAYEPPAGDLASATGFARSQCDNIIIIVVGAEDERVTSFND